MSKHHFVAIGGTGQHVALSYADLSVLAEWFAARAPTTFWLIDADAAGKSEAKSAWGELLLQTTFLRRHTQAGAIQWPDPAGNHHKPYVDVKNQSVFGQLLDSEFGPVFFGEQQRSVKYVNGYYGHAAVASTVFGEIIRDLTPKTSDGAQSGVGDTGSESTPPEEARARRERHGKNGTRLSALLGSPVGDKDSRIVVAGSAVGGTGSGCVPKLIEEIAAVSGAKQKPLALLYLPWFKLDGDDGAPARNQDMLARMASGLLYYRDRLSKHAAAVLIGHPNVEGSNRPRKWAGDTQQPVHADMTLPAYGALAAAQYFDAPAAREAGLYSIVAPKLTDGGNDQGLHLFPYAPASHVADGNRDVHSIGVLWERNVEWLRRVLWIMEWIRSRPAQSTPRLTSTFDVPHLKAATADWLVSLQAAAEAKWRALRRFGDSFKGGDAIAGGPNFPADAAFSEEVLRRAMGLHAGIGEVRDWLKAPVATAEALCADLATNIGFKKERLDGDKYWNTQRLLPPRVGSAVGGAAPISGVIGTLAALESSDSKDMIHGKHVSAYAIPNARSREFVLQCIFDGSLLERPDLGALQRQKDLSDAEGLLARWTLLLVGLAAGSVRIGDTIDVPATPHQLDLQEQLLGAMPETPFAEAKRLLWHRQGQDPIVVGYTSQRTLMVPAALDAERWDELSAAIAGATRMAATDAVRAWGRFMGRLAEAAGGQKPGWITLLQAWGRDLPGHVMFGMEQEIKVSWPGRGEMSLRMPRAGSRADANWNRLFESLGIPLSTSAPAGDKDAKDIEEFLARCPRFTYFPLAGNPEERICIWTISGSPEINVKAGRAIQERYYVSAVAKTVWLVNSSAPIEIVGNNVLLDKVGYIDDDDKRHPQIPIEEAYVDLIDLAMVNSTTTVDGDQVHYTLPLRGVAQPMQWTAKIDGELVTRAGCLLWPNFAAPAWTQRYAWVNTGREGGLTLRVFASAEGTRLRSSVSIAVPKSSAYPIQWPTFSEGAWRPRLLALRPEAHRGRAGVYLLNMAEASVVEGEEVWGVDFGTSGSAIAVNRNDGVDGAVLLRPEGRLDATYPFLLGQDVPLLIAKWFPSWDNRAPRSGAPGVLPTRMVFRSAHNVRDASFIEQTSNYGQAWMLDYGGKLDGVKPDQLKQNFKWGAGVAPYRRAYLLRLLEMAAAWRTRAYATENAPGGRAADPQLPAQVKLVFTVPIRMREEVRSFEEDVQWVVGELHRMTGIDFTAAYQWESLAGANAPGARKAAVIYCALDLGGGSLDLWGAFKDADGNQGTERADSVLLGGRNFLELANWTVKAVDAFRGMQTGDKIWKFLPQEDVAKTRIRFFELVVEASARWIVAFEAEAAKVGINKPAIEVGLLGRAWALGGKDWEECASALAQIEQRARALGLRGTIVPNALIPISQEERKTYLARFVSHFHHYAPAHLHDAPNPGSFCGANLSVTGGAVPRKVGWQTPLPLPLTREDRVHLERDDLGWVRAEDSSKKLNGGCVEVDDLLSRNGEQYLRTEMMLRCNPLHDLLERLVK